MQFDIDMYISKQEVKIEIVHTKKYKDEWIPAYGLFFSKGKILEDFLIPKQPLNNEKQGLVKTMQW